MITFEGENTIFVLEEDDGLFGGAEGGGSLTSSFSRMQNSTL